MNSADDAEERFRLTLTDAPENAEALRGLAELLTGRGYRLQEQGNIGAAIECYEEAIALDPSQARAHNNLGNAYQALGRNEEALASFRSAIAADGALGEAHLNLGIALQRAGEIEEAAACYRTALRHRPALAEANLNLGYLLETQGDVRGSAESYRAAIAVRPDYAEAHFNLALMLLKEGDFARGWEEYEWRLKLPDLAPFWPYPGRPRWDGSQLHGRTILLYAEQGLGDAIQFVRYVPMVAARGGRVVLSCASKLMALFTSVEGISAMHNHAEAPPDFDVCCPLPSLPRLFGTTLETIPADVPYLKPRREALERWREKLAAASPGAKIGLFWATESKARTTALRRLDLEMLAPLAAAPRTTFYSLQRGAAAAQAHRPPAGMTLVEAAAELKDFADDAALIANLDLVISVDTATAHLAGALGRPVWTLAQYPPDWRWREGRDDNSWYPTMRLFFQGRGEPWEEVARRVAQALPLSVTG